MRYIKLLRPHHYIKNLLVYAALLCSGQIFDKGLFLVATKGFIAFCMTASAVYILNDIKDAEKDRLHPVKKNRPIASGEVPAAHGWFFVAIFITSALLFSPGVSRFYIAVYFAINIAYSLGLKDIPIVDIAILSAGFVIRVLYGAYLTDITVSNWLYLTILVFSLYLSLGKRRNEMKCTKSGAETRKVLAKYTESFLDKYMYTCLGLTNAFFALWSMENGAAWTVPIVLAVTMKYSLDIEGVSDGDPVEVLLHDKMLLALCAAFVVALGYVIYGA